MVDIGKIIGGVVAILALVVIGILLGGLVTAPLWNWGLAEVFPDSVPKIGIWKAGLITALCWWLFGFSVKTRKSD